jgi:hypothetical protein
MEDLKTHTMQPATAMEHKAEMPHHKSHHLDMLMEVISEISSGKVAGDNWMVDDCGNLKIMVGNTSVEKTELNASGYCGCDPVVLDVKIVMETNCAQKKAWKRGIEFSKEKQKEYLAEEAELELKHKMPKEIIINL